MNNFFRAFKPRSPKLDECDFYHTIEMPGVGQISAPWDLRDVVDDYLGRIDYRGQRVLEIGPASGFLTAEMEKRGADVVALEVTDDPGWDYVPYTDEVLSKIRVPRRNHMHRIKNSWWFTRNAFDLKANIVYGDSTDLPRDIGKFDIALMGSVLLHTRSPLQIIEQCAKVADALVIADFYRPQLEDQPFCVLEPTKDNKHVDTWWQFSTLFFRNFLEVMGFECAPVVLHGPLFNGKPMKLFTLVGRRVKTQAHSEQSQTHS